MNDEGLLGPNAADFAAEIMAYSNSELAQSEVDFNEVRRSKQDIKAQANESQLGGKVWKNAVLVLVGKRFGLNRIGSEYFKLIKKYMRLNSSCGIVGGKPRFAYYFVGHLEKAGHQSRDAVEHDGFEQMPLDDSLFEGAARLDQSTVVHHDESDRLVFLDPHYVNPQLDLTRDLVSQANIYHCP